ncbi:MAG TPA: hypothetical protein DCR68_01540 [Coprothermobacter sp.]|jgi:UDP-D-galactose:(glucosyl)LPS alpha-1,6-D-galactosyltransferase|nr:hypothetical protein [Coprothermobacter sp.]
MEQKRSIVFLCARFSHGGLETVMNRLSSELISRGCNVVYAIGQLAGDHIPIPEGVNVCDLRYYLPPEERSIAKTLSCLLKARKQFRSISKMYPGSIFVVASDMFSPWAALMAGVRPLYLWIHVSIEVVYAGARNWKFNKRLFRLVDGTIVLTPEMKDEIARLVGEDVVNKVTVIYNPLTTLHTYNLYAPGSHHFLYVGRLDNEQKRVDRLLKALSNFRDERFKLTIIGDGKDREKLVSLSNEVGIADKIDWAGWQTDPWEYVKNTGGAEALILTSDYEGFPAVIVEAMANGIPCISTDCPVGPSDIIQNELNGVIIPMSDDPTIVKSLTDVIKRLLDGSLSFDISLVKQSADKNKPEIVADKWLELMDHRDVR